jgi:hypothetical protein
MPTDNSGDPLNPNSSHSQCQSQSHFTTGGLPPISSSWRQDPWESRPVFFFQLNPCNHSPYVTSSLTRGWVYRLQFLLAFASTVILRSEPRGTHDRVLLSQIRDFPNLEGQVPVFISPRNRVAQLYPRNWVTFSSLPTTQRATVEVFEPASSLYSLETDPTENTVSSVVACWFTVAEMCSPYRCVATNAALTTENAATWATLLTCARCKSARVQEVTHSCTELAMWLLSNLYRLTSEGLRKLTAFTLLNETFSKELSPDGTEVASMTSKCANTQYVANVSQVVA